MPEFVQTMRERLDNELGSVVLELCFKDAQDRVLVADLAPSLSWGLTGPRFQKLYKHPAVAGVWLETDGVPNLAENSRPWGKKKS